MSGHTLIKALFLLAIGYFLSARSADIIKDPGRHAISMEELSSPQNDVKDLAECSVIVINPVSFQHHFHTFKRCPGTPPVLPQFRHSNQIKILGGNFIVQCNDVPVYLYNRSFLI
jgi:hypothetical protein